ncbi:hypothetical protein KPN8_250 [Klebsiella phage KPN8]|nr:hypothetical protein KPN8_250 [Klebsiella phage KPN8]
MCDFFWIISQIKSCIFIIPSLLRVRARTHTHAGARLMNINIYKYIFIYFL